MHPRDPLAVLRGCLLVFMVVILSPARGHATDVDPPDCGVFYHDFGDAPEAIPAYPGGIMGHFPTCLAPSPAGTQELDCAAISTPPGLTGYVLHNAFTAPNFWLGCYPGPQGLDSDADGKVALSGFSGGCLQGAGDCVETPFPGMTFAQDECFGDGSDAGLSALPPLVACSNANVNFNAYNCGASIQVFLNILVDWNGDGDWNDVIRCNAATCAYEWAVKNTPVILNPGCNPLVSPAFLVGPHPGPTWLRVSISYNPVNDDYPWAGSATMNNGELLGGETEDYPLIIQAGGTPTLPRSWGRLKTLYR